MTFKKKSLYADFLLNKHVLLSILKTVVINLEMEYIMFRIS